MLVSVGRKGEKRGGVGDSDSFLFVNRLLYAVGLMLWMCVAIRFLWERGKAYTCLWVSMGEIG